MDLEDLVGLGVLFGGFEIIETVATIGLVLLVIAAIVAAIVVLSPDLLTILAMLGIAVGAAIAGGLLGMKAERLHRKAFD